jgi:hypothetical protein
MADALAADTSGMQLLRLGLKILLVAAMDLGAIKVSGEDANNHKKTPNLRPQQRLTHHLTYSWCFIEEEMQVQVPWQG